MLTCKDVSERVTDYLERGLSWRERAQYWLHLTMCSMCRRYVAQMRMTTALLRRLGGAPPPAQTLLDPALRETFLAARDKPPSS